jgi:biotin-dependent carboxylase-like uncharacterized protein
VTSPQRALEVLATGPLTLVQDLGRPGLAHLGVGRSGAADRTSFRLGARLLAQDYVAAALEVTLGGLAVRALDTVYLALTGAPAPATVDGRGVGYAAPFVLKSGQVLRLGVPPAGVRTYVGVRGGIDVPPVLGSRSSDTLSGVGPAPVQAGDRLPVGPPPEHFPNVDHAPVPAPTGEVLVLRAGPGPRADWLADPYALATTEWTVSARSDRVGVRLQGEPLGRHPSRRDSELPSEGVVRGAVQVPAGGEPVLFLADHPVTGGYPVVAVVREQDVDQAAQAVPGQRIQFRLISD